MAIRADTTDEEVDTTCLSNHLLVVGTLGHEVRSVTVEDMNVLLRTVDVVEQVTGHESVITLRVSLGQAYILIHIEGEHILERYPACTVGLDEGIIHAYGR